MLETLNIQVQPKFCKVFAIKEKSNLIILLFIIGTLTVQDCCLTLGFRVYT